MILLHMSVDLGWWSSGMTQFEAIAQAPRRLADGRVMALKLNSHESSVSKSPHALSKADENHAILNRTAE
jgi:hypothetical protein